MNANTVIAVCATVIAVASLGVSVYEARVARKHNRLSVQPLLGLTTRFPVGGTAGLRLQLSAQLSIAKAYDIGTGRHAHAHHGAASR